MNNHLSHFSSKNNKHSVFLLLNSEDELFLVVLHDRKFNIFGFRVSVRQDKQIEDVSLCFTKLSGAFLHYVWCLIDQMINQLIKNIIGRIINNQNNHELQLCIRIIQKLPFFQNYTLWLCTFWGEEHQLNTWYSNWMQFKCQAKIKCTSETAKPQSNILPASVCKCCHQLRMTTWVQRFWIPVINFQVVFPLQVSPLFYLPCWICHLGFSSEWQTVVNCERWRVCMWVTTPHAWLCCLLPGRPSPSRL